MVLKMSEHGFGTIVRETFSELIARPCEPSSRFQSNGRLAVMSWGFNVTIIKDEEVFRPSKVDDNIVVYRIPWPEKADELEIAREFLCGSSWEIVFGNRDCKTFQLNDEQKTDLFLGLGRCGIRPETFLDWI